MRRIVSWVLLLWLFGCLDFIVFGGETFPEKFPAFLDVSQVSKKRISEYHFFKDGRKQIPNERVIPYDLNTPHFSDYAKLRRFLWVPEAAKIRLNKDYSMEFPMGSVLILTASYLNDIQDFSLGEQLIETRLLMLAESGWQTAQYVWDESATDANLVVVGGKVNVSWIHYDNKPKFHSYLIPNRNQCKQCHEIKERLEPLGPIHAKHLNKVFRYPEGNENQLIHWMRKGVLTGLSTENLKEVPKAPVWNDPSTGALDTRARVYLEMNCSSCHRPNGLAFTSGLDLTAEQRNPFRFGIFKAPVAAGRGVGKTRFAMVPGKPDESMIFHRMNSTDPGIRMPIVGRNLVHEEGVALIREWIAQMKYTDLTQAQERIDRRRMAVLKIFNVHRDVPLLQSSSSRE